MGMDFSALMRFDGPRKRRGAITSLVRAVPSEFAAVLDQWRAQEFFAFSDKYKYNAWIDPKTNRQVKRPNHANIHVALRTPEGFFLTFGRDAIRVHHLLRWEFFLTDPVWRSLMLDACAAICRHFDVTDCILAKDSHSAMLAFHQGRTFELCFESLSPDEHEVETIDDLYFEMEYNEDSGVVMKPTGQLVMRSRSKPLPDGWSRPIVWDSKGFWRFRWREHEARNLE